MMWQDTNVSDDFPASICRFKLLVIIIILINIIEQMEFSESYIFIILNSLESFYYHIFLKENSFKLVSFIVIIIIIIIIIYHRFPFPSYFFS